MELASLIGLGRHMYRIALLEEWTDARRGNSTKPDIAEIDNQIAAEAAEHTANQAGLIEIQQQQAGSTGNCRRRKCRTTITGRINRCTKYRGK